MDPKHVRDWPGAYGPVVWLAAWEALGAEDRKALTRNLAAWRRRQPW